MSDRTDPFRDLEAFIERLNEAAGGGFERPFESAPTPPVDVLDAGDAFEVRVDVPGVERDEVDLRLSGRTLRIRVDRGGSDGGDAETDGTHVRRERRHEPVDRSVELPEPVDASAVSASLADGVLTVTLPKERPEGEPLDIDIE